MFFHTPCTGTVPSLWSVVLSFLILQTGNPAVELKFKQLNLQFKYVNVLMLLVEKIVNAKFFTWYIKLQGKES